MHTILSGHECTTAQRRGRGGTKNGALLKLAEAEFDLFVTADQGIRYQRNLTGYRIAILQLSTNKLRPIVAAAELINSTIVAIRPGEFRMLAIP